MRGAYAAWVAGAIGVGQSRDRTGRADGSAGMKPVALSALLILASPVAAQTLADVRTRGDREFAAADTDRDGVLTRQEMTGWLTRRHAGRTRRAGITADQARMVTDRFFGEMDANGDGRVTRAEARRVTEASFRRLDANGNGRIDPAERRKARALLLDTGR